MEQQLLYTEDRNCSTSQNTTFHCKI